MADLGYPMLLGSLLRGAFNENYNTAEEQEMSKTFTNAVFVGPKHIEFHQYIS